MREAVIVAGCRTAVGRARKGAFRHTRPDELGAEVVKQVLARVPKLAPAEVEDVILGCAFPEGEQGMNLARIVAMRAELPVEVPAMTVNRYCASGLQTIALAAERIMCGFADVIVAGGVESMSMIPFGGYKPAPNPHLMAHFPEVYMSMGHTAEEVAKRYAVTREAQDRFALTSQQRAAKAQAAGAFQDEIVPIEVTEHSLAAAGNAQQTQITVTQDECIRPDTDLDVLATLKPAFRVGGTVTAGNASPTNDGAAAVIVMSRERAEALGIKPLAAFRGFASGGVAPDVMGIGPVVAVPKLLEQTGLTLDEIDLIELNEAFAAQAVAVIDQLELDPDKVNVNGGAIALGHPLGCTGTKLTVSLMHELARRQKRYGIITMCVGGGMGAAGLIERL